jgi:predicted Zn-dependent protease
MAEVAIKSQHTYEGIIRSGWKVRSPQDSVKNNGANPWERAAVKAARQH